MMQKRIVSDYQEQKVPLSLPLLNRLSVVSVTVNEYKFLNCPPKYKNMFARDMWIEMSFIIVYNVIVIKIN